MTKGVIYTETVVHAAPEHLLAEAPYQLAIITIDENDSDHAGNRLTVRIDGDRVVIGDKVEFLEDRDNVPFYKKLA
ncbi:MAG: OB-fold domain-containing protein [Acidobacteriota bacterium]